jgi:hypothetical protein
MFGMPAFHAMACGNGKLITMPDPCLTITSGPYASGLCEARRAELKIAPSLEEVEALKPVPASFTDRDELTPSFENISAPTKMRRSMRVAFVHPSSVPVLCDGQNLPVNGDGVGQFCSNGQNLIISNPCMELQSGWYARTLCHEKAHANGWAQNHPGGSFRSDEAAGVDSDNVPPPRMLLAKLSEGAELRPASASPAAIALAESKAEPVILASIEPADVETGTTKAVLEAPIDVAALNLTPAVITVTSLAEIVTPPETWTCEELPTDDGSYIMAGDLGLTSKDDTTIMAERSDITPTIQTISAPASMKDLEAEAFLLESLAFFESLDLAEFFPFREALEQKPLRVEADFREVEI